MRNREAARYARWAAIAAGLIVLYVAGVYARRAFRESHARRDAPAAVPVTVAQQSAQFSFSKVEQNRTLFTVRASHFTQYKDQNRAVLEDVWITLYGREGNRNDNIHTRECSYEPDTGAVHCQGEVQIDAADANPTSAKSSGQTLQVKTSNLSFNRNTGEATTPAPVEFSFPAGQGRGVGVSYSSTDSLVRVDHAVEFNLAPSTNTGGLPVTATGSSLEIHRDQRIAVLLGPAIVRQGARELSAGKISIDLDEEYHARHAVAEGHPQIHSAEGVGQSSFSANRMEASLNPAGWVESVVADGGISGTQQTAASADHFSAMRVEFAMLPERNLIKEMTATGGVTADSKQGTQSRVLKTDALRVTFSSNPSPAHSSGGSTGKASGDIAEKQRVESAETLAPATIESRSDTDTTTLHAKKFVAQLNVAGRLDKLFGHSGVEIQRQIGKAAPQVSSAAELAATFGTTGDWDTLDESGNVQFQQADRRASAASAKMVRATDIIMLDGLPVISDSMSRTTASNVVINQKSGELHALGGVVSTYLPTTQGDAVNLGSGPAHVSADSLSGSVNSGHLIYAGHARLWQGNSVLDTDQIQLWRDDNKLEAIGHVVAVFPQASGPFAKPVGILAPSTSKSSSTASSTSAPGPTLWKVVAPMLTYWSDQGKAHFEGGVMARSAQGSLDSRTLDVFLGPDPSQAAGTAPASNVRSLSGPSSGRGEHEGGPNGSQGGSHDSSRELNRVVALGNVVVRQGDRQGMAEQAEYTAADGKFVLLGGQPTVTDGSSNTATGHSLTFYIASDTILIDSQEGSRTLTRHRVEK